MKIAVLGTGSVGQFIASKLVKLGHDVMMGSRTENNPKAQAWLSTQGANASIGNFNNAASYAEVFFLCVKGEHTITALQTVDPVNLTGKVLIDVTNPIAPGSTEIFHLLPELTNQNSLSEELQKNFKDLKVVKSLNTVWGGLMAYPGQLNNGDHSVFMSSNWDDAKVIVNNLLIQFGWREENIIDLGDITTVRGTESYIHLWVKMRR
jgi:predicted dinucleotide-binding enzyme